MESGNTVRSNLLNVALMVALLISTVFFGWLERPVEMAAMILAGAVCLAFANIDRIQSFKGAGFEAEMRNAVNEAYTTTAHLKAIATPLILTNIMNLTYGNRWDGLGYERELKLKNELSEAVKLLELDSSEIDAAFKTFYIYQGVDLIAEIYNEAQSRFQSPAIFSALQPLIKHDVEVLPSVEALRQALSSLSPEHLKVLEPQIARYESYLKTASPN